MTAITTAPTAPTVLGATAVNWHTDTLPDGRTSTTAHIGDITVSGHTVSVFLDYNPTWFAKGRAKGRTEDILSGPSLTTGPGFTALFFHVEAPNVDPARYLAYAPDALTEFRPEWAPKLTWKPRVLADGRTVAESTVATVTGVDGRTRPVVARYDRVISDLFEDYAVVTAPGRFVVAVNTPLVSAREVLGLFAQAHTFG